MAFMALAPLQDQGVGRYQEALHHGLRWVTGENELRQTLVDRDEGLVYRAIQRVGSDPDGPAGLSRSNMARLAVSSYLKLPARTRAELELLRECRSYHLGWLLYARALVREWQP
jgi:hypothetical protein